jgi:thiol-disulfide isomerase/thioredoxin
MVILVITSSFLHSADTVKIYGKIFSVNGSPCQSAKIHMTNYTGDFPFPLPMSEVNVSGNGDYAIKLKPGAYLMNIATDEAEFTGIIPVYIDGSEESIKMDIRLTSLKNKHPVTYLPELIFENRETLMYEMFQLQKFVIKHQIEYMDLIRKDPKHKGLPPKVNYDWNPVIKYLSDIISRNDSIPLQQFAALKLGELHTVLFKAELNVNQIERILTEIPAESPIWSLSRFAWLPFFLVTREGISDDEARIEEFAAKNPDRIIRGYALATLAGRAESRGDHDELLRYYRELINGYADISYIQNRLKRLNPNKRIKAGEQVPDFSFGLLNGANITPEKLKGKYYLIDFWATWCGPCLTEMKYLHQAYEKFKNKGLEILSLSFDQDVMAVHEYRKGAWDMPWLHVYIGGAFDSDVARTFEVFAIPRPILVGPDGIILKCEALRGPELLTILEKFINGRK